MNNMSKYVQFVYTPNVRDVAWVWAGGSDRSWNRLIRCIERQRRDEPVSPELIGRLNDDLRFYAEKCARFMPGGVEIGAPPDDAAYETLISGFGELRPSSIPAEKQKENT